jgi:hypothetical protein
MLDNFVNMALYRIFGVSSSNVLIIRQYLDLPLLKDVLKTRGLKFIDKLYLYTS